MQEDNYMSLKIINFETALYIGEYEDLETECNSILQEQRDTINFLKMKSVIMNSKAVHLSQKRKTEKVTGTLPYLAPERVLHQPYDYKVDVFSIGVIFYILLANCHPYENLFKGTIKDYIQKIYFMDEALKVPNFELSVFRTIPNKLLNFINSLIQLDAEKRRGSKNFGSAYAILQNGYSTYQNNK